MKGISWICLAFLVYFATWTDAGPKCFDCTRIPFPRDCDHIRECGEHEVCLTKQFVSDSGHVFYDTGCMDSVSCSRKRMTGNNSSLIADDEAGDLITCTECCHGDYCNSKGCGTTPLQPFPESRGPMCFNCHKGTVAPEHCEIVTVCSRDEHCSLEPIVGIGGDHLYKTGCKKVCPGKRATTPCTGCCKADFCNRDCSSASGIASVTTKRVSSLLTPTRQAPSSTTRSTRVVSSRTTRSTTPTVSSTHTRTHASALPTTPSQQAKEMQCLLLGYEYLKNFNHCVKPYKDLQLTWQNARDRCIKDGGDLLIFHNKVEESYFESWLFNMTGDKSRYWVGASDLLHEGTWQWVDSTAVDEKLYFHHGEPNNAEMNEDCAAATYHPRNNRVLLNDDNCDLPSYFICEANFANVAVQTTASSHQFCRNSGYRYDSQHGICFRVYDSEMKTMSDARANCQIEHADLLQLRDMQTEMYFLHQSYDSKNVTDRRYWLGASRHSDGQFYWFNGKHVETKDYIWGIGEPNNLINHQEDCLEFLHYIPTFYIPAQYALNDENCKIKDYYICEERCPDKSYSYVPGLDLCFKIHTSVVTWNEAQNKCRLEHADLAEPNTLEKIDFFHKYLTTLGTGKYWIGGKQSIYNSKQFIWQTSKQPISSELWHTGEPNSLLEQCASLYWYNRADLDKLFRVNDMPCSYKLAYICQYIW